eukprot:577502-Hanusia_phi.AAC.3
MQGRLGDDCRISFSGVEGRDEVWEDDLKPLSLLVPSGRKCHVAGSRLEGDGASCGGMASEGIHIKARAGHDTPYVPVGLLAYLGRL